MNLAEMFMNDIRFYAPTVKTVLLTDDVHYIRAKSLASSTYMAVKNRELSAYISSDMVITVTLEDEDFIRKNIEQYKGAVGDEKWLEMRTRVAKLSAVPDKLADIPLVKAVRYVLRPEAEQEAQEGDAGSVAKVPGYAQRKNLIFTGHATNPTNLASIRWFLYAVWPRIQTLIPGVKIQLMGHGKEMYDVMIAEMGRQGVEAVGFVEKPLPYINSARVFLSPIVVGTGVNTKNLFALQNGIPLVTTDKGRQGFCPTLENCSPNGEKGFLVSDDAEMFAQNVFKIYDNEDLWDDMHASALLHARTYFTLQNLALDVHGCLEALQVAAQSDGEKEKHMKAFAVYTISQGLTPRDLYFISDRTNLLTIWALNGIELGSNGNMLQPGRTLLLPTARGVSNPLDHGIVLDSIKYNRVTSLTTFAGAYVTSQQRFSSAYSFSFNTWERHWLVKASAPGKWNSTALASKLALDDNFGLHTPFSVWLGNTNFNEPVMYGDTVHIVTDDKAAMSCGNLIGEGDAAIYRDCDTRFRVLNAFDFDDRTPVSRYGEIVFQSECQPDSGADEKKSALYLGWTMHDIKDIPNLTEEERNSPNTQLPIMKCLVEDRLGDPKLKGDKTNSDRTPSLSAYAKFYINQRLPFKVPGTEFSLLSCPFSCDVSRRSMWPMWLSNRLFPYFCFLVSFSFTLCSQPERTGPFLDQETRQGRITIFEGR